ncbi:MAG TPA: HAMP domain-containing histidine kinase [Leptolyngbyaceae cyanobacterium M33_DOE_097]|nr:HAMP domain-containing histidine kinase [Leptolyngbyaceae cyanobacterium M33_DOE_097]
MRFDRNSLSRDLWVIIGLVSTIIVLELVTSADYVFSYLYIGPVLLASLRFDQRFSIRLTLLVSGLTLFNLWIPGSHIITPPTIANRFIAVFALFVTALLANRNRFYEGALAQQRAKLQFQEKLASLQEDFVSTLTHDLKTPLLGAIETLKAFQQGQFGDVTTLQQKVLATMLRSHQSSLKLIATILDVYRNDSEGMQLVRSPINLIELTEQVIQTLNDLVSSYQVSVQLNTTALNTQQACVNGDELQLQRVLSNLLINAIYHSPLHGTIEVILKSQSHSHPPEVVIQLLDEGPGIHSEELPQLFERFFQGHSDRQAKGSGLGLYLSRQIVEAHGGKIWAENREIRGAVFGFCLPALTL